MADKFSLYKLVVSTHGEPSSFVCDHILGDNLVVEGESLHLLNYHFSLYALSALLPLVPAKQRETHANDWMTSDEFVACPDPHCGARFKIRRSGKMEFNRDDVTVTKKGEVND